MRVDATPRQLVVVLALTLVPITALAAGSRHAGTVVAVGPDRLVLDELGVGEGEHTLEVYVIPKTRIVESRPKPSASSVQGDFTEKTIALSDIESGDFVIIDASREGKRFVAESVTLTLRGSRK